MLVGVWKQLGCRGGFVRTCDMMPHEAHFGAFLGVARWQVGHATGIITALKLASAGSGRWMG